MGFLHLRPQCTHTDTTCSRCGLVHTHSYLECTAPPTCANCGGSHPATAKICPIYLEQVNQHEIVILRQLIAKHPQTAQSYLANSINTFNSQKDEIAELRNILKAARHASNNATDFNQYLFNASSQLLVQDDSQLPQIPVATLPSEPIALDPVPEMSSTHQQIAVAPPPPPAKEAFKLNKSLKNIDYTNNNMYIQYDHQIHPTQYDTIDRDNKITRNNKNFTIDWYPKQSLTWEKSTGEIINTIVIVHIYWAQKTIHFWDCRGKKMFRFAYEIVQHTTYGGNELTFHVDDDKFRIEFFKDWDGKQGTFPMSTNDTPYEIFTRLVNRCNFEGDTMLAKIDYEERKKGI